jgi:hypothetical protein
MLAMANFLMRAAQRRCRYGANSTTLGTGLRVRGPEFKVVPKIRQIKIPDIGVKPVYLWRSFLKSLAVRFIFELSTICCYCFDNVFCDGKRYRGWQ